MSATASMGGSVPLTTVPSVSSGESNSHLSTSPLDNFADVERGLDQAADEPVSAEQAVRRYNASLKKYTASAFEGLKRELNERNAELQPAPKGFHPVPAAAGLV